MEYNYFKDANLLVLECDGKHSLYRLGKNGVVEPQTWAQNQKRLDIYPEYNLVVTDDQIYTMQGKNVLQHVHNDEVIFFSMCDSLLVQLKYTQSDCFCILWWDGQQILKQINQQHRMLRWNENFVVVLFDRPEHNTVWEVYDSRGNLQEFFGAISCWDIKLYGNFLVVDGLAQHNVYHLSSQQILAEKQQRIVASSKSDFMMCSTITGELKTWFKGKWAQLPKVEDFGLLADDRVDCGIYYLRMKGKYFLYFFDGSPFRDTDYPQGVDYAGYNADSMRILIMNEGKAHYVL